MPERSHAARSGGNSHGQRQAPHSGQSASGLNSARCLSQSLPKGMAGMLPPFERDCFESRATGGNQKRENRPGWGGGTAQYNRNHPKKLKSNMPFFRFICIKNPARLTPGVSLRPKCVFSKKDRLAKPRRIFYLQDMKNTPHPSAVISLPTPTAISDHYADYLLFFLENRCEMSTLKQHFSLTSKQVLEFLTSRQVKEMLEALHESVRSALSVNALKARDFAIDKMKTVCLDLVRQTAIPASGTIDESKHAKAVNFLRLATSQLGRFAAATLAPPKSSPKVPSQLQYLVPEVPVATDFIERAFKNPIPPIAGSLELTTLSPAAKLNASSGLPAQMR